MLDALNMLRIPIQPDVEALSHYLATATSDGGGLNRRPKAPQSDVEALSNYLESLQAGDAAADEIRAARRGAAATRVLQLQQPNFQAQKVTFLEGYFADSPLAEYPQLRRLVIAAEDIDKGKQLADQINAALSQAAPAPGPDQIVANYRAGVPLNSVPALPAPPAPAPVVPVAPVAPAPAPAPAPALAPALGVAVPAPALAPGVAVPPVPVAPGVAGPVGPPPAGFTVDPQVVINRNQAQLARVGPVQFAEIYKAPTPAGFYPPVQIDQVAVNGIIHAARQQRGRENGTFSTYDGYCKPANLGCYIDMNILQNYGAVVIDGDNISDEIATVPFLELCFYNYCPNNVTIAIVQAYGEILKQYGIRLAARSAKRASIRDFWTAQGANPVHEMSGYGLGDQPLAGTTGRMPGQPLRLPYGSHSYDPADFKTGRLTLWAPGVMTPAYSKPMSRGMKFLLGPGQDGAVLSPAQLQVIKGEGVGTMDEYRHILKLTNSWPQDETRRHLLQEDLGEDPEPDPTPTKTLSHRLKLLIEEMQAGQKSQAMQTEARRIIMTLWQRGNINQTERDKLARLAASV